MTTYPIKHPANNGNHSSGSAVAELTKYQGKPALILWERILEIISLIIIAYIGWGVGNSGRLLFQGISPEDIADLAISHWMSFSGYCWCKFLVSNQHHYFFGRKTSHLTYSILTLLTVLLWETLTFWLYATFYYRESILETSFFPSDVPLILVVLVGMIAYLQVRNFILSPFRAPAIPPQPSFQALPPPGKETEKTWLTSLLVSKGKAKVMIAPKDFAFFLTRDKLVWLYTREGEKYLIDYTLTEMEERLNPMHFFRVNRQVIISRSAVKGYFPVENQKLLLQIAYIQLSPEYCIISKYTAPSFKNWLAGGDRIIPESKKVDQDIFLSGHPESVAIESEI